MPVNSTEIEKFIQANSTLFWSVPASMRGNISLNLLVETILQYGDLPEIRRLFELIGIKKVAAIFREQTTRRRCNYHPRTINYFRQYFARHAF